MELIVLQPFTHLTTDPLPLTGLVVDKLFRIGNDKDTVRAFAEERFAEAAGTLDTFQLANNHVYAYVANKSTADAIKEVDALAFLHAFMVKTQLFMLALWMIKDNSANAYEGYLRLDDIHGPHYLSERFSNWFFMADCEQREVHFTAAELDTALAFYAQFDTVIPKVPNNEKRISGLIHDSRVARTLYFLQAARTTGDLLVKIAFYCMCLESLFSTDKEGINYRVAERTALFIGSEGPERRKILEDVTKLYGTRSKVVHGNLVKENQLSDLFERVKQGDAYLRACLAKILGDPAMLELFSEKPNEGIIEYFRARVFD